jgi:hypothetical protein
MLQKGETSIHLTSGGAFAKGLEVTRKRYFDFGDSFEVALAKGAAALFGDYGYVEPHPKYQGKAAPNLIGALAYYFETWPIDRIITPYKPSASSNHAIEWNFSVPIPHLKHPDTNEPILYCGRFDMIGEHEGLKMLMGEDDKTTSQLGDSWFNRWRLSNQILGYSWGAREHGINLGGFNIRGVSLLKNNYGHAEAPIMVNGWQIDRFVGNLIITVRRMVEVYKEDVAGRGISPIEMDMSNACAAFGGCDYLPLCESPDPSQWIPINYVVNEWNPLASRD